MAKSWVTVLTAKGAQWEILPLEVTILNNKTTTAQEALNLAMSGNRSPVITAQANAAFHTLIDYMRFIKNRKFFVPPLTNVDLVSLGLRPRDTIITPAQKHFVLLSLEFAA